MQYKESLNNTLKYGKCKEIPVQVWIGSEDSRGLRLAGFKAVGT
jgi:hypothetical protein